MKEMSNSLPRINLALTLVYVSSPFPPSSFFPLSFLLPLLLSPSSLLSSLPLPPSPSPLPLSPLPSLLHYKSAIPFRLGILIVSNMMLYHHLMGYNTSLPSEKQPPSPVAPDSPQQFIL